jgi:hypothetical protein
MTMSGIGWTLTAALGTRVSVIEWPEPAARVDLISMSCSISFPFLEDAVCAAAGFLSNDVRINRANEFGDPFDGWLGGSA